jgi:DNA-binding response OmpR family regulator
MKNILIVEPADDMGGLVRQALEDRGHKASWAKTAQSAVHLADEASPDAVILELAIPEHNGVEFLHEFRSYPEWMDVPVILYSHIEPDRTPSGRRLMDSLGVVEHLYKPTSPLKRLVQVTEESIK